MKDGTAPAPPSPRPEVADQRRLRITAASDIRPVKPEWLWADRVPLGYLTLVVGDGGLGKSTLAIELAACLTHGQLDGDLKGNPVAVIYASAEDNWASTIVPRLMAAAADRKHVFQIQIRIDGTDGSITLPDDLDALREAILDTEARCVVIDPLVAHLSDQTDTHKDHSIRRVLAPLAALADELGIAIICIVHLNKTQSRSLVTKVSGSSGMYNAARSVLLLARDTREEDDTTPMRVLSHGKCNVGPTQPPLSARVESRTILGEDGETIESSGLSWQGEATGVRIEDLLGESTGEERSARVEARDFLLEYLGDSLPHTAKEIFAAAQQADISKRTLNRAKRDLGIESRRSGFGGGGEWMWRFILSPENANEPPRPTQTGSL